MPGLCAVADQSSMILAPDGRQRKDSKMGEQQRTNFLGGHSVCVCVCVFASSLAACVCVGVVGQIEKSLSSSAFPVLSSQV